MKTLVIKISARYVKLDQSFGFLMVHLWPSVETLAQFQIKADTVVKLLSDRNFKICFHLFSMSVLASEGRNRPKKVDPGVKFEFSQSRNQRWAKYSKYSYSSTILPVLVLVLGRSVLVLVLVLENKKINT